MEADKDIERALDNRFDGLDKFIIVQELLTIETENKRLKAALVKAKAMIDHRGHPDPVCVNGGFPTEDGGDQCQWCDEYSQITQALTGET